MDPYRKKMLFRPAGRRLGQLFRPPEEIFRPPEDGSASSSGRRKTLLGCLGRSSGSEWGWGVFVSSIVYCILRIVYCASRIKYCVLCIVYQVLCIVYRVLPGHKLCMVYVYCV